MLNLGANIYGSPATLSKGRTAIRYMLQRDGINLNTNFIDNGCGLSRKATVSAKLFADVFDKAYLHYGQRWLNTLSIAGVDGTIRRRFAGSVVRKRAFMKTGTLKYVKNIGGYVKAKNGKTYVVVILVNSKKAKYRGSLLQNWIIEDLVNGNIKDNTPRPKLIPKVVNGGYYIEVASLNSMPSNEYLTKISNLGLSYRVGNVDNKYKVLIGGYETIGLASKDLAKVRENINQGSFITKIE
jgi:D-alanyl-D-alanine carboxypeptidase/D-alanyl-D-alanine-endopeptidase (penicillin-binding protein 4)